MSNLGLQREPNGHRIRPALSTVLFVQRKPVQQDGRGGRGPRAECSRHWRSSLALRTGIDALLRELANPNLHDIVSMQNRVELWTADGQHVRWAVAATANITIGYVAFEAAVRNWPHERFTLRQGALLIREHPVMR